MSISVGSSALKLGCWVDDLRLGVRDGLKRAAQWHCDAVGVDILSSEITPRSLSTTGRKELARLIQNSNAKLAAVKADTGGRRLSDPQTIDATLALVKEAFELARDLGAGRVLIPLGYIPEEGAAEKPRIETSSASIFTLPAPGKNSAAPPTTNLGALNEAARAIAALGSNLGVRPCVSSSSEPVERLEKFLQGVDPGNLIEIDLNPGAWTAKGEDPSKALFALNSRLGLATSMDHYRGGAEAVLGTGDVPWPEVVIGLSSLSRSEPLAMLVSCHKEGDRVSMIRAGLEKLTKLRLNPLG
jgi:sugar phosphate isomerase/epimerase